MEKNLYAIRDTKAGVYLDPHTSEHDIIAIRGIQSVIKNNPRLTIAEYPGDFDLYQVGTINTETGRLSTPASGPRHVSTISALAVPPSSTLGSSVDRLSDAVTVQQHQLPLAASATAQSK